MSGSTVTARGTGSGPLARAPLALRSRTTVLLIAVLLGGCRLAGGPPATPAPVVALDGPAIAAGAPDDAVANREVARLLGEAEALLAEGRFREARDRTDEVERLHPNGRGSGLAFLIRGRAARGLEEWASADAAIARFLPLVSDDPARRGEALLLRADVRREGGLGGAFETLFEVPREAGEGVLAEAEARSAEWAATLDLSSLRALVEEAPPHPRLLPVFLTELAVRRYLGGDEAEARARATEALALAPGDAVAERARGVLEGRVDASLAVAATIAAVLPETGPPSLLELARDIRDGIELAVTVEPSEAGLPVRFLSATAPAAPQDLAGILEGLAAEGASAVIGALDEASFRAAAAGGGLPLLSPTARLIPEGLDRTFSLTAVDPGAGRALAELVLARGVRQVFLMHPSTPELQEEARWFREAYLGGGGSISRTIAYPPGTTSFAEPLAEIVRSRPQGLVLLLSAADVETLAPQLSFYGVREVEALTLFGNEAWASVPVLEGVQPRHTDGVFAITTWAEEGSFGPGWHDFVDAYESHFQRTLRSPVPALGYDAARLLLRAAREGGDSPEGTLRAFQEIRGFPGATGVLSVVDGRIVRDHVPVRIENRRAIPLTP